MYTSLAHYSEAANRPDVASNCTADSSRNVCLLKPVDLSEIGSLLIPGGESIQSQSELGFAVSWSVYDFSTEMEKCLPGSRTCLPKTRKRRLVSAANIERKIKLMVI